MPKQFLGFLECSVKVFLVEGVGMWAVINRITVGVEAVVNERPFTREHRKRVRDPTCEGIIMLLMNFMRRRYRFRELLRAFREDWGTVSGKRVEKNIV